jgi:hypothetical protein
VVRVRLEQAKVLRPVVVLHAVLVIDDLVPPEVATEDLFHHEAVLPDVAAPARVRVAWPMK